MPTKKVLIIIVIAALFIVIAIVAWTEHNSAQKSVTTSAPAIGEQTNLDPAAPLPVSASTILVSTPTPESKTNGTVYFSGTAKVFEGQFAVRILRDQAIIFEQNIITKASLETEAPPFDATLKFPTNGLAEGDKLILEAFEYSAKDGSIVNIVRVPLIYSK